MTNLLELAGRFYDQREWLLEGMELDLDELCVMLARSLAEALPTARETRRSYGVTEALDPADQAALEGNPALFSAAFARSAGAERRALLLARLEARIVQEAAAAGPEAATTRQRLCGALAPLRKSKLRETANKIGSANAPTTLSALEEQMWEEMLKRDSIQQTGGALVPGTGVLLDFEQKVAQHAQRLHADTPQVWSGVCEALRFAWPDQDLEDATTDLLRWKNGPALQKCYPTHAQTTTAGLEQVYDDMAQRLSRPFGLTDPVNVAIMIGAVLLAASTYPQSVTHNYALALQARLPHSDLKDVHRLPDTDSGGAGAGTPSTRTRAVKEIVEEILELGRPGPGKPSTGKNRKPLNVRGTIRGFDYLRVAALLHAESSTITAKSPWAGAGTYGWMPGLVSTLLSSYHRNLSEEAARQSATRLEQALPLLTPEGEVVPGQWGRSGIAWKAFGEKISQLLEETTTKGSTSAVSSEEAEDAGGLTPLEAIFRERRDRQGATHERLALPTLRSFRNRLVSAETGADDPFQFRGMARLNAFLTRFLVKQLATANQEEKAAAREAWEDIRAQAEEVVPANIGHFQGSPFVGDLLEVVAARAAHRINILQEQADDLVAGDFPTAAAELFGTSFHDGVIHRKPGSEGTVTRLVQERIGRDERVLDGHALPESVFAPQGRQWVDLVSSAAFVQALGWCQEAGDDQAYHPRNAYARRVYPTDLAGAILRDTAHWVSAFCATIIQRPELTGDSIPETITAYLNGCSPLEQLPVNQNVEQLLSCLILDTAGRRAPSLTMNSLETTQEPR